MENKLGHRLESRTSTSSSGCRCSS